MIVKDFERVEFSPVSEEGVHLVEKAILIGPEEGAPNFVMRRFELDQGGYTPFHQHNWEHVVYVLAGSGKLIAEGGEYNLKANSSVLVLANEKHQFKADEKSRLTFLCMIPKL